VRRAAQLSIDEHQLLAQRLRAATQGFFATGVGYADAWLDFTLRRLANVNPSTYFRELATEHGRPAIHAIEQSLYYGGTTAVELRLPRTQRLDIIVGQLVLLASEAKYRYAIGRNAGILDKIETTRSRFFYFKGGEGKALFEHWLNQCRTDPVFRISLQLPPLPTT
jgi:hypothetical protein